MAKKGLQKFTDLDKVKTKEEFDKLPELERYEYQMGLLDLMNEAYKQKPVDGETVAKVMQKMETVLDKVESEGIRNQTWQGNHVLIQRSIHKHIQETARFPMKSEIAEDSGLTRQTVHKHLKSLGKDFISDEMEMIPVMAPRLLSSVYQLATNYGDMRAYKLYLDHAKDYIEKPGGSITINNTQINIQTISGLPGTVQAKIEKLIRKHL